MSTGNRTHNSAIFLSAVTYQAIKQFENKGPFVLPKRFTLVTRLGGPRFLGFIIQSKHEIIIAFRGTEDIADIFKDVELVQVNFPFVPHSGKTHNGFTKVYRKLVRNGVIDTLFNLSNRKKLYIAGHSLGGALATLCALDVAVNTKFKKPILYTFGSPRVGNSTFVTSYKNIIEQSIRVANAYDMVPRFPPQSLLGMKYHHIEKELPVRFLFFNPLDNHEIGHYFKKLCSLSPAFYSRLSKRNPQLCPPEITKDRKTIE
jgi:triacylglycerol lipase